MHPTIREPQGKRGRLRSTTAKILRWTGLVAVLAGSIVTVSATPAAATTVADCLAGPHVYFRDPTSYRVITGFGHDVHALMVSYQSSPQQQWGTCAQPGLSGFAIVNVNDGTCLDVEGDSTDDGARIQTWACHFHANQRWTYDSGSGHIRSRRSGKCVDIIDGNRSEFAALALYTCHSGWNQKFTVGSA